MLAWMAAQRVPPHAYAQSTCRSHCYVPRFRDADCLRQVEATKGALWDAYAEVAIYMEILHVQAGARGPAKAAGERSVLYVCVLPCEQVALLTCCTDVSSPMSFLSALSD